MTANLKYALAFAFTCSASAVHAAPPSDAQAIRDDGGALVVSWTAANPVDVFVSDRPDAPFSAAGVVSARDGDGREALAAKGAERSYITLRDTRTGETTRLAERVLPLAQGSNFRDIGGYPAGGGRHVKWGSIYRSGGTPLLSDADLARVKSLGLAGMIDLRSDEERVLAPTRIDGVPYSAIGYSMGAMGFTGGMEAGYRSFPKFLAPQVRMVFRQLLRAEGPVAYNCSAGQDRTGFVTALVLSALGTPRDAIIADYHLSTTYRQPEFEMPRIDPALAASNPVAAMFASYQKVPAQRPQPLKTADGKAFLSFALEEIDGKWGSVDRYLEAEIGLTKSDLRRLRKLYTE